VFFPENFFSQFSSQTNDLKKREIKQTRVIESQEPGSFDNDIFQNDFSDNEKMLSYENNIVAKIALEDGEILMAALNENFDDDVMEEQILAYRNLKENEGTIYITYIDFDETTQVYKRIWNDRTIATKTGTVVLYMQDLIGDRVPCVLLSGMNSIGERTLTVFRKNNDQVNVSIEDSSLQQKTSSIESFNKIAELQIDGTISVKEAERTQAYQRGIANGQPFPLIAYGKDAERNILDKIEIVYTYNSAANRYEQSSLTHIPGKQVEEQQALAILRGGKTAFENFITGLWYWTAPDGTVDNRQYIYFDPHGKEVIFYIDETQQVFIWQNSGTTRYGLHISTQNISVQTLRRSLDIAFESLESVRIKVSEDVRLKIGTNAGWDGSYKKANTNAQAGAAADSYNGKNVPTYIEAVYNSTIGKIQFSTDGVYELLLSGIAQKGRYSFFYMEGDEVLEMRPENGSRETYIVEHSNENLSLRRIRIGANGIQDIHEPAVFLSPVI
jgi:hypothetical protein